MHNMPYSLMASQLNTLCHLHRCIHCLHYATQVTIHACRLTLTPFSHTTQKYITRAAGRDISHIKFKKQNKNNFRSTDLNFFTVKKKVENLPQSKNRVKNRNSTQIILSADIRDHVPVHLWGLCLVAMIYSHINCAKSGSYDLGHTHLGQQQFSQV